MYFLCHDQISLGRSPPIFNLENEILLLYSGGQVEEEAWGMIS
jgi:hypothetical protein